VQRSWLPQLPRPLHAFGQEAIAAPTNAATATAKKIDFIVIVFLFVLVLLFILFTNIA
jgi:hypothetical protein